MKIFANGTVLYGDSMQQVSVAVDNDIIVGIGSNIVASDDDTVIDCTGKYILPSLIDIHTHGAVGYDFNSADSEGMVRIMEFFVANGVGGVLPTIMTDDIDVMARQCTMVAALAVRFKQVLGIHLEGPFLNADKCGAMPKEYIIPHNIEIFDKLYEASCGKLKMMTMCPEGEGAIELIRHAVSKGVVVSLGHSCADYETTARAVESGATNFTHTFNAMPPLTHRQPNMVGCALTSQSYCEVICDGIHVDPVVINIIARCKSIDNVIAITDSCMAAGLKNGKYKLGVQDIIVKNGKATLVGSDTLAGSTVIAVDALTTMLKATKLPLPIAIKTMTANPAKLLGLYDKIGSIDIGKVASFIILGD